MTAGQPVWQAENVEVATSPVHRTTAVRINITPTVGGNRNRRCCRLSQLLSLILSYYYFVFVSLCFFLFVSNQHTTPYHTTQHSTTQHNTKHSKTKRNETKHTHTKKNCYKTLKRKINSIHQADKINEKRTKQNKTKQNSPK